MLIATHQWYRRRVKNSGVHLEKFVTSLSQRNGDESGGRQYVALSTRTNKHRSISQAQSRLCFYQRARACQSIIRIGLLKFLGTDGERMEDIHSFGPALRKARDEREYTLASSIPTDRYIHTYVHMLFPARMRGWERETEVHVQGVNPDWREGIACHLISWLTLARCNCFDCRRVFKRPRCISLLLTEADVLKKRTYYDPYRDNL